MSSILAVICLPVSSQGQNRLSDHVRVQEARTQRIVGYGLVTGLDRTGDRTISRRGAQFTVRSIANMLENFGISVDPERLRTRNAAAVMVTAEIGPYHSPGSEIDVTVSSIGDARSLRGGVLLQTPLMNPQTKQVYAKAQGPLVSGGIKESIPGASLSRNGSLTATIPGGGIVEQNSTFQLNSDEPLGLILDKPGYINAERVAEVINGSFDEEIATISNPGLVEVEWPESFQEEGTRNVFVSTIMQQEVDFVEPARIVINERTGTIVTGGNVTIDNALVSHGSVQVRTQVTPVISQPPPFSGGTTTTAEIPEVGIREESAQNIVMEPDTNVEQLADALDSLGLNPRDIISIFQALDRADALNGELIVM